ncbi:hypothetical protein [Nonlabens sp.]|uniref:hypothetical protein n=1 Tax=Nonlabens sp. TaxID=1888209 RepID=UPI003F696E1D
MILYYLTIAVQIFCFYHIYKNRNEYYWYAIIFFLPAIGSLIYLFMKVFNSQDAQMIGEEITTTIQPAKRIKDLIEKVKFSDTFANRLALADAYFDKQEYQNAVENYQIILDGAHKNDVYVQEQLVIANYHLGHFDKVIELAKSLRANSEFRASKIIFFLGLSYKALGKLNNAEKHLRALDVRYSNYQERLVLAQFLVDRGKQEEAKELVEELLTEFNYMSNPNKKTYKTTIAEVKKLSDSIRLNN